jgi:hypothetical protein
MFSNHVFVMSEKSQLPEIMKGRRCTNNKKKTQIIQNIFFGAFTERHNLLYIFYITDIYFGK